MRNQHILSRLCVLLLFVLAGCTGGDDRTGGSAPVISGLELDPTTATVGSLETLRGSLVFEDPDGDVLELHSSIASPTGGEMPVPPAMIAGAAGTTAGAVSVQLSIQFVALGDHTVRVWVRDAQGNDSNALTRTIAVGE
jgi:hypothetical protein